MSFSAKYLLSLFPFFHAIVMDSDKVNSGNCENFLSRLAKLYPYTDVSELPLCWSNKDKANYIALSENNLKVHYKGQGRSTKEAASVRTALPVPASCLLYYFEIKVLSKGRDGYMGIGLAAQGVNTQKLPGWDHQSFGYHGDDGQRFASTGAGTPYGPVFTTNDVIGCGYNLFENNCFFTKNGYNLGVAFSELPNIPLFPTVGLLTPGEEVEANFGSEPFRYDIDDDMKALRQRITSSIIHHPVRYTEWQTAINKLIQSWLIHNGYCSTAEVFSAATKQEFKENVQNIKQRLRIQQLVLSGKIEDAINLTNRLYPDVLKDNPDLLFALKCRQFVEMISETCGKSISNTHSTPSTSTTNTTTSSSSTSSVSASSFITSSNGNNNTITIVNSSPPPVASSSTNSSSTSATNENNSNSNFNSWTNGMSSTNDCNGISSVEKMDVDHGLDEVENTNGYSDASYNQKDGEESDKLSTLISFGRELHQLSKQLKKKNGTSDVNRNLLLEVSSLMAYSDPSLSPLAFQLHPSGRETVCQQLNNAIVKSNVGGNCPKPALEKIVKHTKCLLRLNGQCGAWLIDSLYN